MQSAAKDLYNELGTYGLNPKEWALHWIQPIFEKANLKRQHHKLHIVNMEDQDLYFEAEALLEKEQNRIKAKWQSLSLMGI